MRPLSISWYKNKLVKQMLIIDKQVKAILQV